MDPTRTQRAVARARQNPPTVLGGVVAALVTLLTSLANWLVASLPESVPAEVSVSFGAFLLAVIVAAGVLLGRLAQRWTYPVEYIEAEVLTAEHAIESARAAGELDEA